MRRLCAGLVLAATLSGAVAAKSVVYVSEAVDGDVAAFAFDPGPGHLTELQRQQVGAQVMPMAVAPDHRHLYAVLRSQPYKVVTLDINQNDGRLSRSAEATLPDSMAYANTDRSGRLLLTASYGGDLLAVTAIDDDGRITAAPRQILPSGQHAHCILTDRSNRFVFATNLGSSQIQQFRLDRDNLLANNPPAVVTAAPSSPRHAVWSADNRWLYVLNEFTGMITTYAFDPVRGTLQEGPQSPSLPADIGLVTGAARGPAEPGQPDWIWAADLQITPDGRFLYATERSSSRLAVLRIDPASGVPHFLSSLVTETQPRGIAIDPTGQFLVAAGEKSDRLSLYRIDGASGALTLVERVPVGRGANWISFVEIP